MYQIITDSSADLNAEMLVSLGVQQVSLGMNFKGKTIQNSSEVPFGAFYSALRGGENVTTFAANPDNWCSCMEPALKDGKDVLIIAFSSGLSTTCQSACIAAAQMQEIYPERKIIVVDSLCASLGQGMLVWYATKKQQAGASIEELAAWLEENKLHLCHFFTVDDLMFLKRGGRVSAATAVMGTMLNIKPVLHVDNEGHLINIGKVRGRKASLDALLKKAEELGYKDELAEAAFICHGDCEEDAKYVEGKLKEKFGTKYIFIDYTGTVIGAHSGPGTLALFFLGEHR